MKHWKYKPESNESDLSTYKNSGVGGNRLEGKGQEDNALSKLFFIVLTLEEVNFVYFKG